MTTDEKLETVVDLVEAETEVRSEHARGLIAKARGRVEAEIGKGVPQAVAARVLGISETTLSKWVKRGDIKLVTTATKKRQLVSLPQVVLLATEMRRLRVSGEKPGLLAEAISRLQWKDPQYRREFDEQYGESLAAMQRGETVPAGIPSNFGPED